MIELNKIYNEDCLIGMKRIPDKSVDHSFTSPPYNRKRNDKYNNYDDTKDDWYEFMSQVIKELLRVTRGYVFFNIQKNYYNKGDVFKLIGEHSEQIQEIIVWNKTNPTPSSNGGITNAYEFILVLGEKPLKANKNYTKNVITTSVYSENPYKDIHRAVMKPQLASMIISNFTNEGDVVLDCFMGLGTTAIACIDANRKYIGFELDEGYCKISLDRIKKHTKQITITDWLGDSI